MIPRHKKEIKNVLYHMFLGAILLTVNLYFFIFVHYENDLSPNFALGLITIPFGVYELYKAITYNQTKRFK